MPSHIDTHRLTTDSCTVISSIHFWKANLPAKSLLPYPFCKKKKKNWLWKKPKKVWDVSRLLCFEDYYLGHSNGSRLYTIWAGTCRDLTKTGSFHFNCQPCFGPNKPNRQGLYAQNVDWYQYNMSNQGLTSWLSLKVATQFKDIGNYLETWHSLKWIETATGSHVKTF